MRSRCLLDLGGWAFLSLLFCLFRLSNQYFWHPFSLVFRLAVHAAAKPLTVSFQPPLAGPTPFPERFGGLFLFCMPSSYSFLLISNAADFPPPAPLVFLIHLPEVMGYRCQISCLSPCFPPLFEQSFFEVVFWFGLF